MAARKIDRGGLPLGEIPAGGALAGLTGALVCLAVLALAASAGADGRLADLMREPQRLTIAVPAAGPPDGERLARVAEEICRMPGVVGVREVPIEELLPLLPPGLVRPGPDQASQLPRLLDVGFLSAALPDSDELAARLAAVAPGVTVGAAPPDADSRGAGARRTQWLGWLGGAVSFAGLVLGVTAVARRSLASQAATVRLLRSLGAGDTHVSSQFEERAARAALGGAAVGFAVALGVLALLGLLSRTLARRRYDRATIDPRRLAAPDRGTGRRRSAGGLGGQAYRAVWAREIALAALAICSARGFARNATSLSGARPS